MCGCGVQVPLAICGSQRTTLGADFLLATSTWILGIELGLPGLQDKYLYTWNLLVFNTHLLLFLCFEIIRLLHHFSLLFLFSKPYSIPSSLFSFKSMTTLFVSC